MKQMRILFGLIIGCGFFCLATSSTLGAASFPTKPITMIVPSNPAGSFDIQARAIASVAKKHFGVPVIVENVPGASFTLGAAKLARSRPDGYTLHSSSEAPWTMAPITLDVAYDPLKDVEYLCSTAVNYQVVAVNSKLPFKTMLELLDYVKKNPKKIRVSYSSTLQEFWLYNFIDAGYEFTPVVFTGGGPAAVACGGGHTDVNMGSLAAAQGLIESGNMRLLAYTPCTPGSIPVKNAPGSCELPPQIADCFIPVRVGVHAPKGIPKDRLEFLEKAMSSVFNDKEYRDMLEKLGFKTDWVGHKEDTERYHKLYKKMLVVGEKHGLMKKKK